MNDANMRMWRNGQKHRRKETLQKICKTLTSSLTAGSDVNGLQISLSTSLPSNFTGIVEEKVPVTVVRCNSRSEI